MLPDRPFTFSRGSHKSREDGLCVMEAVAYVAGEPHSDHPECADPVITRLAIWLNDSCGDSLRQELLQGLPFRIVGTKATPEIECRRAFMAADWAVRFVAPVALRAANMESIATKLEGLGEVNGSASDSAASAAGSVARSAHAARSAAGASAAGSAASAAAYADDAAAYAAAAAAAAGAAARYAALEKIQRSCAALIDRMIRLTELREPALQKAKETVK